MSYRSHVWKEIVDSPIGFVATNNWVQVYVDQMLPMTEQLLREAKARGETPPAFFHVLTNIAQTILASVGFEPLSNAYQSLDPALVVTEIKNTFNIACWAAFDSQETSC
ncbi:MAG: hypothetical protein GY810_01720 [Aureispira sp.]|nr:hypothetical protein [Aureispira sp.]